MSKIWHLMYTGSTGKSKALLKCRIDQLPFNEIVLREIGPRLKPWNGVLVNGHPLADKPFT